MKPRFRSHRQPVPGQTRTPHRSAAQRATFGPVHNRPDTGRCRCGTEHHKTDPALGTPFDPDRYDYAHAVLWNNHAPELWRRFLGRVADDPGLHEDYRALVLQRGRGSAQKWLEAALDKRIELELVA